MMQLLIFMMLQIINTQCLLKFHRHLTRSILNQWHLQKHKRFSCAILVIQDKLIIGLIQVVIMGILEDEVKVGVTNELDWVPVEKDVHIVVDFLEVVP